MEHEFAIAAAHEAAMTAAARNSFALPPTGAIARCVGVLLFFVLLGGCGAVSDDTASNLLVSPRKYQFHNCQLLVGALKGTRARIDELEKLTARASQSPVGRAIAAASYRTEYLQARGDEKQIIAMLREKNCESESTSASERSVY